MANVASLASAIERMRKWMELHRLSLKLNEIAGTIDRQGIPPGHEGEVIQKFRDLIDRAYGDLGLEFGTDRLENLNQETGLSTQATLLPPVKARARPSP